MSGRENLSLLDTARKQTGRVFENSWKCGFLNQFYFQGDRGFDGLAGLPGEKGNRVSSPLQAGIKPWEEEEEEAGMRHRRGSIPQSLWDVTAPSHHSHPKIPLGMLQMGTGRKKSP